MRRGRLVLGMLGALALVHVGAAVGCVDGVTPDCSDPAIQCGPSLDGAVAEATPDAARDTSPDTFLPDAMPDADLDAGDEQ